MKRFGLVMIAGVALTLVAGCSSSPEGQGQGQGQTRGFSGEVAGSELAMAGGDERNPVAWALVVGVDDYADDRIQDLELAGPDAAAVSEFLQDRDGGGLEADRVVTLIGADATVPAVDGALDTLDRALRPQDTLILYLSCHGHVPAGQSQVYFVLHDTSADDVAATGLDMQRVLGFVERCRARRVVLIADACHSGATSGSAAGSDLAARQLDAFQQAQQQLAGKDMLILSSCSANQQALELESLGHGVFTWFLLEGLREFGDTNRDGVVSSGELGQYVTNRVEAFVATPAVQAAFPGFRQTPRPFAVGRDVPLVDVSRNPFGLSLQVFAASGNDGTTHNLVGFQRLPGRYPVLEGIQRFRVEVTSQSTTPVPAAVVRWSVSDTAIDSLRLVPDGFVATDNIRTVASHRSLRFPDPDRTGIRDAVAWVPDGCVLYLLAAGRELDEPLLDELERRVTGAIDPARVTDSMREDLPRVLDDPAFSGLLIRRIVCFHGRQRERYLAPRASDGPQAPGSEGENQ